MTDQELLLERSNSNANEETTTKKSKVALFEKKKKKDTAFYGNESNIHDYYRALGALRDMILAS